MRPGIAMPIRQGLLIVATAILLTLSFPSPVAPRGVWPLGGVALVPLLVGIWNERSRRWKAPLVTGLLVGVLFFYGSFYWLGFSFIHYGGLSPVATYALLSLPGIVLGLFFGVFALALHVVLNRWGSRGMWAAGPLWVVMEWLRYTLTGQGWNALGYSQAFRPEVIQCARLAGVYGVSFLLVTVSAACAFGVVEARRLGGNKTAGILGSAIVGYALIAALPAFFPHHPPSSSSLSVVAIQPVISLGDVRSSVRSPDLIESLRRHFLLSEEALADAPPDNTPRLLIWPESPMNMSLDEDPVVEQLLENFARERNVYLLVNHLGRAPGGGFHNSAAVISPEGRRMADYHKTHLLIFGEYVPFRHVLPLVDRIPALAGDFVPGAELTVAPVGPAQVGTFICFESTFPSIARTMVRRGADILVNISNDGWFGATVGAYQHLAHAVFRAVETERPLVRVTNSGVTALITPQGEIKDATGLFQPATRRWQIAVPTATASSEHSFYTRYGDVFVLACGLASLVIVGRALPFRAVWKRF